MGVRNDFQNDEWIAIGNSDDYVTYLPSTSAVAATWNRKLAYKTGQVLGTEARGRGKDVILAPGINIKRSPLCGRNFEYISEDPYLTKETAVPIIKGIQESDVAACVKHFAVNNQETERLKVEVEVSDRALRELYLPGFQAAVQEGDAYSVMGAYNRFKGEYCCQSKFLLNDILKGDWGYGGIVISDWGGVNHTQLAVESGLDIEMSVTNNFNDYYMAQPLKEAIEKGDISETLVDKKVSGILHMMSKLNMLGDTRKSGCYNTPEHRQATLEIARESVVLLKNEEKRLPLANQNMKKLLVIGDNAERIHSNGGGSAEIKALYEISPLMGLKSKLGGNIDVTFARGYYVGSKTDSEVNWQQDSLQNEGNNTEENRINPEILKNRARLLEEAVALAKEADDVIIIGGLNHDHDSEGNDRETMELPYDQDKLIQEVLKVNPNAVVVMIAGSPIEMGKWINDAKAIVWGWYGGMEGGNALAEVLFGETNPSGKLPETFGKQHMDYPAHCIGEFPGDKTVAYTEEIFVGYRYFDTYKVDPLFAFGHGLSYTTFEYSNIKVEKIDKTEQIHVSCDISNTGDYVGSEVVQLYVRDKVCSVQRPLQELKGYEKIVLLPNETKQVEFVLDHTAFHFYDDTQKTFYVESGKFDICVRSSSRDIRLIQEIEL